jgi:hypothetical protein
LPRGSRAHAVDSRQISRHISRGRGGATGPLLAPGLVMLISSARHTPARRRVAMLAVVSLLTPAGSPLVLAQAPAAARPAAAAAPAPPDGDWPRGYTTASGAALVIYQPQVASWTDQKRVVLYSAVSYTPKAAKQPAIGTIKVESETGVALDERLVSFSDFKITESNFPTLDRDQVRAAVAEIGASVPLDERVIALDRVLANVDTSQIIPKNVEGVKADPPPIFFSSTSAVLVNIDGDPIWAPIPQNDLTSAVNTNWDLFEHGPTKTYYLRHDQVWLKAAAVKGPWTPAGTLPASFAKLPDDDNWKEVKASLPGKKVNASQAPTVFVSLVPAELLMLRGKPSYVSVTGAPQLLWVNNTDSDVFRMGLKGPVYFLIAGRWFSAPDFMGPWTFATPTLPADFTKIPLEHERSRVLASVPGTSQAAEAILLAQVPQTARVSKTVQAPEVEYQGTPEFQPIDKTTVQRAVNTDKDILKVGDLYYMCFQGVWFMSRAATGPWTVTSDVPKQIYEIPVSSPSHNVTYVTVEDSDDDAVVFATAAAYTGVMIAWGCAVWGTGYYYPPYMGYYGGYPIYYPHYPTYGYGASYNPWTGAYTRGAVAYGPYGGAGAAARYNPRTGTYSRGAVAYGPYGARGAASAYNPRTGTSAATRQGSNVYGSWGATGVQRGDQWAATSRYTNNVTGATTRRTETSGGGSAVSRNAAGPGGRTTVGQSGSGDIYAGHDGNVYRKQGDSWQQYGDGGWSNANQPTPQQRQQGQDRATTAGATQAATRPAGSGWNSATAGQVTRDSAARAEGAQRTRDAGNVRSGTAPRSGSYRPSGGGGRPSGGGGRRR